MGMSTEQWLLSAAAVATISFLAVALYNPGVFDPEPDWEVSDGCLGGLEHSDVGISFHYHPSLKVIVDGQQISIEPNTGIDQIGCREGMRWIHVHDSSDTGFTKLHIETPSKMNVPLGAFFEIWEREGGPQLDDNREFDIDRNGVSDWEEYDISMTVNSEPNEKFEAYVMEDHDDIELIFTSK
ncbi:MAG TPA: hypothetical protein QF821_02010 [Candidatus Thalassarchaeaceae archaeon]|jgi:hypothetical protein|nr:hypothetical protein [Candidatus Thalassarchaeaceae archaeon]|tara:strand:- start:284 stop:832 length:549 start_codon:yes stop_codon:yes gene_type:complete